MTVEVLSRIQFAFSIAFHILFPTLNLGLAMFLCIMEGVWLKTKNPVYLHLCQFWTKIFAITFGMGVVSGIVLSYQIGTNFGPFIIAFGDVLGALFAYETLSAFFLEAGFLGIMLYGWNRVPSSLHYAATCLVAFGTTISAFWIMSANSWMQTPSGFIMVHDHYIVNSWLAVIFNPSFIPRYIHMVFASYATTCFVVSGISAYYLLQNKHIAIARRSLSFALWAALIVLPIQMIIGDVVGINVYHYQPLKTAAIEGNWETQHGAPLVLFALPRQQLQKNDFEISIPKLASFINTHEWDGELIGLKSVKPADQPQMAPVFFSFRIMVGIGVLMLLMAIAAVFLRYHDRIYTSTLFLYACMLVGPLGFISSICGWFTAEMGRQPWVVYNLMRTKDSVSAITIDQVAISLGLIILTYGIIFGFYLYYLFKLIKKGPHESSGDEHELILFQYMNKKINKE